LRGWAVADPKPLREGEAAVPGYDAVELLAVNPDGALVAEAMLLLTGRRDPSNHDVVFNCRLSTCDRRKGRLIRKTAVRP
jgi:hypothetical protein